MERLSLVLQEVKFYYMYYSMTETGLRPDLESAVISVCRGEYGRK